MENDENLTQVYSTADATDGMLAKSRLEAEGIPVFIKGDATDNAYPTSGTYLWVNTENAERAEEILKDVEEGDFEIPAESDPEAAPEG